MTQYHFTPEMYREVIAHELPLYGPLHRVLAREAAGVEAGRLLDLGTGTGETLLAALESHPGAHAVGIDESPPMLARAEERLEGYDVDLRVADLLDPLPDGPFDLVTSALAVHHLDGPGKAELFRRVAAVLAPTGRFVLADVVIPPEAAAARAPLSDGYDKPSTVAEQVRWLRDAGFDVEVVWQETDLAVWRADRSEDP